LETVFADALRRGAYDAVTFTSASSVDAFAASLPAEEFKQVRAFCIGDMTAGAAARNGMRAETSPVADIDGLAAFIVEKMGRQET
ncbi:MAG: uroporphyrinogen-III synthase, partial [Planctomycetota bacterium]|nr:uroporphyrinogen-III synthase [Planctomycetota bacterium]